MIAQFWLNAYEVRDENKCPKKFSPRKSNTKQNKIHVYQVTVLYTFERQFEIMYIDEENKNIDKIQMFIYI